MLYVTDSWVAVRSLWPAMVGGAIVVAAMAVAGHVLARHPNLPIVQGVDWWVRRIVLPLLRSPSWLHRATTIFFNNITILSVLVAMGGWPNGAVLAIGLVGLSLGIAMRRLTRLFDEVIPVSAVADVRARRKIAAGLALNLLEPPAIMVAIGLSLRQWVQSIDAGDAWIAYLIWVVPAMLLAAGGESLWIGASRAPAE